MVEKNIELLIYVRKHRKYFVLDRLVYESQSSGESCENIFPWCGNNAHKQVHHYSLLSLGFPMILHHRILLFLDSSVAPEQQPTFFILLGCVCAQIGKHATHDQVQSF